MNKQPNQEVHGVRSGSILSTGASIPIESEVHQLPDM